MFSRHRRFYEITGKYFVCSDRWIWDGCGWDSTSPTNCTTYLSRSICLSNMKIFLKVVNTQQVYLESDIQHLPMPHFWDITSDHITFISLNDGSRESIALLYLLLFLCEMPWASEYYMSPHDWHILKIPSGFQPLCKQWWLSVILWSAFPFEWVST